MSSLPPSTSSLRVGESDRDDARRLLNEHQSAGRLTPEELGERAIQAVQARTREDLQVLFRDLPAPHPEFDVDRTAPAAQAPDHPRRQGTPAGVDWKFSVIATVAVAAMVATRLTGWADASHLVTWSVGAFALGVTWLALTWAEQRTRRSDAEDRQQEHGSRS